MNRGVVPSLYTSEQGKEIVKLARNAKGWTIDDSRWLTQASQVLEPDTDWHAPNYVEQSIFASGVSLSTWKRFLRGQPVQTEVFKAFCQVLGVDWRAVTQLQLPQVSEPPQSSEISLEFPSGPVPLNSRFYIERPPIETLAYQEICNPGSVIRIQAPRKMGKSSLIIRILARAEQAGYHTVSLDFRQADDAILTHLDKFLRWFCANVTRQLRLKPCLEDYWDEEMGSKICCTLYFQAYLLEQLQTPVVLVLNEVNRLFEYPQLAQEFLPLLRSWHEEAKHVKALQKLRLLVAYSTEVYVPLHIEQSPFNVGLPLKLPRFNLTQVQELAQRHGLNWSGDSQAKNLVAMVGGHPYLIRLALYHLRTQNITLKQLLQEAPTISGIYNNHLQNYLLTLQKESELAKALYQVVTTTEGVRLPPTIAYKLDSMGLVLLKGNEVLPSCDLYRLYFKELLG
jgi:hypothetical protein